MIQAVLSNPDHPDYGVVTIPFPIPHDQFAHCMELLAALEVGDAVKADCRVEKIDSFYTVLKRTEMLTVNVEELNYLAKRLDGFDAGEAAQFQAMVHNLELFELKDLINLTFCCQQVTVITDFSDLAAIGRDHYMNLHGGCVKTEELDALDGEETARRLIESGSGTITPYGVVYDTIAPNGTASRGKTYRALQSTQLKECWIVRYADDFKILCRKRSDAVKLFAATQQWLKARLGLDISPEKSGIVNLKKHYTEFLGIKIRVRQKGKKANGSPGYTVYSGMTDKAYQAMKSKVQQHTRAMAHPADTNDGSRAVDAYNAYVLGIHNYYRIATNITLDMRKIAFLVKHELNARLRRYTQKSGDKLPSYIAERYGNSKMLRYVYGRALIPIGYLKHKAPMFKPKKVNRYTPEGRAEIHKSLSCVNISILREMMRNPIMDRSVEYNDNRLSLYCGQMGRCYVTKQPLELGHMHCHHRIPRHFGGDDKYGNLVLVTDEVHRLLHATRPDTIAHYILKLKPDSKQLRTLNRLRRWLQLPEFQSYTSY